MVSCRISPTTCCMSINSDHPLQNVYNFRQSSAAFNKSYGPLGHVRGHSLGPLIPPKLTNTALDNGSEDTVLDLWWLVSRQVDKAARTFIKDQFIGLFTAWPRLQQLIFTWPICSIKERAVGWPQYEIMLYMRDFGISTAFGTFLPLRWVTFPHPWPFKNKYTVHKKHGWTNVPCSLVQIVSLWLKRV